MTLARALCSSVFLLMVTSAPAAAEAPAAAAAAAPAPAAAEGPTNEDCLSCHTDPTTTRADGKPVLVDTKKWGSSIHGEVSVSCTDCHADLAKAELPHADRLAPAQCVSCHEKAVPEFARGIHSKGSKGGKGAIATCATCHGPAHEILASGDRRSPTHHLNLLDTCAKCHADPKVIASNKLPAGVVQDFKDSIHGKALNEAGLLVAPTCSSCHGAHDVRLASDPESRVSRAKQSATCGSCHEGITEKYAVSIHATKVAEGKKDAPVCADCHTAHSIQRHEGSTWELEVMNECGTCHKESLASYRDTFHGRVTELGFARMAKCASCHGAHDIVDKKDPRSRVAGENLIATCKKCHPGATASFAKFDPHANPGDKKRSPSLYYTALGMKGLLFGVFGFFGLHTLMWLGRGLYDLRKRRSEPPKGDF